MASQSIHGPTTSILSSPGLVRDSGKWRDAISRTSSGLSLIVIRFTVTLLNNVLNTIKQEFVADAETRREWLRVNRSSSWTIPIRTWKRNSAFIVYRREMLREQKKEFSRMAKTGQSKDI